MVVLPAGAAPAPPVRETGVLADRRRERVVEPRGVAPRPSPCKGVARLLSYGPVMVRVAGSAPATSCTPCRRAAGCATPWWWPRRPDSHRGRPLRRWELCLLSYGGTVVRMAGSAPAPSGWKPDTLLVTPHPDGRSCGLCPRGLRHGAPTLWLSELNSDLVATGRVALPRPSRGPAF